MNKFWNRHLISAVFAFLISLNAFSANYTIQSKVLDRRTNGAIEMGTVRLLNVKDSSLVVGTVTDRYGSFTLKEVPEGNFILECKYLGYKDVFQNVTVKDRSLILKNILMDENAQDLSAVQVTGMAAQMIVKVDTMEFNAAAFQTAENAVVEDLLKKLPGVQINDGAITVNGETISRIKVNGKKFFDGDIEMTTKNLTADMVDKIQVIDEKSDMAKLTGFEDENTERIINITIKKNRMKGLFGNVAGGGGADLDNGIGAYFRPDYDWNNFVSDDFRYNANTFLNYMLGDSQTAFVAGANNANSSRSSMGRGMRGWGNGSGITSTQNIGINNNTAITDSLLIGGDASYNHSRNISETESVRDSWLAQDTLTNNNRNGSISNSDNANLRLEMEWTIDTLTTLILQPSVSRSRNTSDSWSEYDYYTNGDSTSWGNSHNNNVSDNLNARLNAIINRKSARRAGRSFTANIGGDYGFTNSDGYNSSEKLTFEDTTIINQRTLNTSDSYGFNFRGSYVEPLWNLKNFLEIAASFNYSDRTSEKLQYNKDEFGEYIYEGQEDRNLDREYSNNYRNTSMSEVIEANYRYNDGTLNLMAGFHLQPSQNKSNTTYMDGSDPYSIHQEVVNFSPTLSIRYNLGERRNFVRMEYRGNSQQPSVTQMQPVKNNSNLMNETVGNASLVPAYSQNLRLITTKYNAETFASWNLTIGGSMTQNALVSNSIYDRSGKQYNQTVNADRIPFNLNGSFMYNTPVVPNLLHLNTRTNLTYQERVGYTGTMRDDEIIDINDMRLGDLSLTQNYSFNEDLSLTLTHNILEIGARGSFRYANTFNHLSGNRQNTMDWSGSGNINLHLPFSFNIATDLSFSDRAGYANFDQKELLWNASIDKTIRGKVTIALSMTDILRQRLNINQSIGDNYNSYNKYNTLPSYFLLTVTYKISHFGGKGNKNSEEGGFPGMMPGMPGYQRGEGRPNGTGNGRQNGGTRRGGGMPGGGAPFMVGGPFMMVGGPGMM